MSLQDDIFDVIAVLKGKPEAEQFDRIYEEFGQAEEAQAHLLAELKQLKRALAVVGTYMMQRVE